MPVLQALDALAVRRWCALALDALVAHQGEIDELNVYPVPDHDTGTNLVLTLRAALASLGGPGVATSASTFPSTDLVTDMPTSSCAATMTTSATSAVSATSASMPAARSADLVEHRAAEPAESVVDVVDAAIGVRAALADLADGAVLGARGNSGVIVSQFLRGLSDELRAASPTTAADGAWFAAALARADRLARAAVARPVEGTALSVIRAAAAAARAGDGGNPTGPAYPGPAGTETAGQVGSLANVTAAAAAGAAGALGSTPKQLPVLARAGVVDAGGRGVVVLLDTLAAVVAGLPVAPTAAPPLTLSAPAADDAGPEKSVESTASVWPAGSTESELAVTAVSLSTAAAEHPATHPAGRGGGYEVQYLLDATESDVRVLRARLADLGESVAIAGTGSGRWNVHVHVEDIGAAIEAGLDIGRPSRITVTPLVPLSPRGSPPLAPTRAPSDPDTEDTLNPADTLSTVDTVIAAQRSVADGEATPGVVDGVAVVAVAPGEGICGLLEAEGVVVTGAGSGPVTVEQVRAAIAGTRAASVIVLPNHGEVTAIADAAARAARAAGQRVSVVPTRSAVQGLAAVAVHDEARWFDDDVIAMAEAAAATRFAEVEIATREALTMAGRCQAGDVLGLAEGDVVLIRQSVEDAAGELLDRMLSTGGELVTVILGRGADPDLATELTRRVAATHPAVEVQVYDGGQPDQPVVLGVE